MSVSFVMPALALALLLPVPLVAQTSPPFDPLTRAEIKALRQGVERCWNTAKLSRAALEADIVVAVWLRPDGTVIEDSIALIKSRSGDDEAVAQAYDAAHRALLVCGKTGLPVPLDKYATWRELEMSFGNSGRTK
ncbi:TonB C-terminal domain-containing protein [Gemmobacter fulvus]|uniref:TonB C-terminal domain-containing protein n=1 Tax=Gemmobacter fulvus TaxID=2840474 RepID=A0A975P924_9RHOB|nr:TonB C-terminal domain-containing protein [Gemmobacter fulvus]MBT9244534.1 TonB C-terminal domain-containing protein [Gemmobacter fulvus]QWK91398.1 TonB C-terminal domain-containing protein [Gemmobacter fulvus]